MGSVERGLQSHRVLPSQQGTRGDQCPPHLRQPFVGKDDEREKNWEQLLALLDSRDPCFLTYPGRVTSLPGRLFNILISLPHPTQTFVLLLLAQSHSFPTFSFVFELGMCVIVFEMV